MFAERARSGSSRDTAQSDRSCAVSGVGRCRRQICGDGSGPPRLKVSSRKSRTRPRRDGSSPEQARSICSASALAPAAADLPAVPATDLVLNLFESARRRDTLTNLFFEPPQVRYRERSRRDLAGVLPIHVQHEPHTEPNACRERRYSCTCQRADRSHGGTINRARRFRLGVVQRDLRSVASVGFRGGLCCDLGLTDRAARAPSGRTGGREDVRVGARMAAVAAGRKAHASRLAACASGCN